MKRSQVRKSIIFSGLFAVLGFLVFWISMPVNRDSFEEITRTTVVSYELQQLGALLFLFGIGLLFMLAIRQTLSLTWCVLLAFPSGICLWVFASLLLLLTQLPYTFPLTAGIIALELALTRFLAKRLSPFAKDGKTGESSYSAGAASKESSLTGENAFIPLVLLGFVFLTASGFNYSFVSYDSYFYFINYGHTLTIVKSFQDIVGQNSFTLTNICQFLPLVHSYAFFWGLDQAFAIQNFLAYDVVVSFFYGLWLFARRRLPGQEKRAALFSALFALLLISSTSFLTVATWVLANMYCMAYIFFLFLASFWITHLNDGKWEAFLLIAMDFTALTLLRKDGIIFAAFFLVCFCGIQLFSKKHLALLFLPASIVECVWLFYVRVVLNASVTQAVRTSIANNKNIAFIALIILGSFLYIFVIRDLLTGLRRHLEKKLPFLSEYMLLLMGMLLLFPVSFWVKGLDPIIDNVDCTIKNMFRYPSAWGISAFFFGVLIVFSIIKEMQLDYLHFLWIGYSFLNLISYCLVDSKLFWVNWDDSYNRVLLQIVPVFLLIMAVKSLDLLQPGTQDRSFGSSTSGGQ